MFNQEQQTISMKYRALSASMNERLRRLWAGSEAKFLGRGGLSCVHRATGLSINTIVRGIKEANSKQKIPPDMIRHTGGGRKQTVNLQPRLKSALEYLVSPATRGDPESPLLWTSKSTRHLSQELSRQGYQVSHALVARLLKDAGYSLQANRKSLEGCSHPDRNAQFEYINQKVLKHITRHQPAISVDTKKKEIVGIFKNGGQEWRPRGRPTLVNVHDFPDPNKGKAIPYGVYDILKNTGWVSVGIDHDTATFAVKTIGKWWKKMGKGTYPKARSLLVIADSGGSNGTRVKLWKWELQKLSNKIGIPVDVSHLPPGTSKWNKIEHRLFSFISKNWRGKPLLTYATIVSLIAHTITSTGLKVKCELDKNTYPIKIKPTDEQMSSINIQPDEFHGDWNYKIAPQKNI